MGPHIPAEIERPINEYITPILGVLDSSIVRPEIEAAHFEVKPVMLNLINSSAIFSGLAMEDPHAHLKNFMEICDSFKLNGVTADQLRMKLFSFSLRDRARVWLNSMPPNSIVSWTDLTEKFLRKYFPPTKSAKVRMEIHSFQQTEGESLYDAWERFKGLTTQCPQHGIPGWQLIHIFYTGLGGQIRTILDAAAGGTFLGKTYTDAYDVLERMTYNNYQWASERSAVKLAPGKFELDTMTAVQTQLAALSKKIDGLSLNKPGANSFQAQPE
ncbi:hypothetical protein ACJIZ3_011461 [Penstemon smallii]|uniref:Retrotransposon gag domain-containing protein n=1 Tax=Penstemon smallii TaxID=265156 RepID=A0ABD3UJ72_9LAMI